MTSSGSGTSSFGCRRRTTSRRSRGSASCGRCSRTDLYGAWRSTGTSFPGERFPHESFVDQRSECRKGVLGDGPRGVRPNVVPVGTDRGPAGFSAGRLAGPRRMFRQERFPHGPFVDQRPECRKGVLGDVPRGVRSNAFRGEPNGPAAAFVVWRGGGRVSRAAARRRRVGRRRGSMRRRRGSVGRRRRFRLLFGCLLALSMALRLGPIAAGRHVAPATPARP